MRSFTLQLYLSLCKWFPVPFDTQLWAQTHYGGACEAVQQPSKDCNQAVHTAVSRLTELIVLIYEISGSERGECEDDS